jgi:hypothetical protein
MREEGHVKVPKRLDKVSTWFKQKWALLLYYIIPRR